MSVSRNRLANVNNEFQGNDLRVLCVCSAGLLRSPTMAKVLLQRFEGVNPRAVGTSEEFALIPVDGAHLAWAQVILCAENFQKSFIEFALEKAKLEREIFSLDIPDDFNYGDSVLEDMIERKVKSIFLSDENKPKSWFAETPRQTVVENNNDGRIRLWD